MEGIDKPHTGKYREITNDSNYDASYTLASLPVWDSENFKRLIFVVQSVPSETLAWILKCLFRPNSRILRKRLLNEFSLSSARAAFDRKQT
jgi:hypothetical protein